uniref:Uncharacterized protein n=1 Tax=Manihot esculenta TaxID=3983 RepID=A0A2C9UTE6_MANES
MHQGAVLVPVVWAGEAIKMEVTTLEQEAMVSISVVHDKRKSMDKQGVHSQEQARFSDIKWKQGFELLIPDWTFSFQRVLLEVCFTWSVRDNLINVIALTFLIPLNGFYIQFKREILVNLSPLL